MPFDAPFPISFLTLMIFNLSSLLDSGKHDDISLEDVKEHARAGDLIPFLNDRAKRVEDTFDNGFFEVEPRFVDWYGTQLRDICEVMDERERRKYGIESRGLCLLISYTAEIIQRGENIRLRVSRGATLYGEPRSRRPVNEAEFGGGRIRWQATKPRKLTRDERPVYEETQG